MNKLVAAFILLAYLAAPAMSWAGAKGKITPLSRIDIGDAYSTKVLGLFIGIQNYRDPFWHDLKYPRKDVSDMVAYFTENEAIKLDYKMVLNQDSQTTRDYILNHALDTFDLKNASPEDMVIVYISSHGTLVNELFDVIQEGKPTKSYRKVPYILTSDSRENKITDSAIALRKVTDWFEGLRSRRKVLILDMCHSGRGGKSQLSPDQAALLGSAKGISYVPFEDSQAAIILTACPIGGTSFEDNALQNSVYTHFLLKGMRQGDLNGDGAVTISEAHNYAIDRTRQYTWEHKHYKQVPTTYSKILGKDPLIVYGKPSMPAKPILFSYTQKNHGLELFVDGVHQGLLPKGIPVNPGKHTVALSFKGQTVYRETVRMTPGSDYELPEMTKPKAPQPKTLALLAEGGYRGYLRDEVPQDLLPATASGGFSLYHYNTFSKWIGLSGGFNYGENRDLQQLATQIGLKLTLAEDHLRFFVGPDLLIMFCSYADEQVGGQEVDRTMTLFCPGAEALFLYTFDNGMTLGAGLRAHYMPYTHDGNTHGVVANQGFLSLGYSF
jgi:hypothetical protein